LEITLSQQGLADSRQRPTMHDVARLAGVGIKTVSRVVNGVPTVSPELAARVHAAAEQLGYRPNLTASNLRRGDRRTNTIGLLVEDVGNPFSAAVHRAVEEEALTRGVMVLSGSLEENPVRERELARALIARRVDGLIIAPGDTDYRWVVAEQQAGIAFVFIDRIPSPLVADAITTNNAVGASAAVAHLVKAGRPRVAYLGDDLRIQTAAARYAGYQQAMAAAGLAEDLDWVRHGLRTIEDAREAALAILDADPRPDALFCSQNLVTIGAVAALHRRQLEFEVALVGFDDFLLADAVRPGVTVIAQDTEAIGRVAAQRLFARMDGDRSAPQIIRQPFELIARGSGELRLPSG
jgi:LacI family transcriptional regulator, galactose operon repressor